MSTIRVVAIDSETAARLRASGPDANGMPAERTVSDGVGKPCRHCLDYIPKGAEMLIVAHRPFGALQPYAESGPVFLCARDCVRWEGEGMPPVLAEGGERLLKGYSPEERIVYGLGRIVSADAIAAESAEVLSDPRVAFVHARSPTNNCFTCRIDRS